jgi:hypothetical protein
LVQSFDFLLLLTIGSLSRLYKASGMVHDSGIGRLKVVAEGNQDGGGLIFVAVVSYLAFVSIYPESGLDRHTWMTTLPSLSLVNMVITSSVPLMASSTKCLPVVLMKEHMIASLSSPK